MSINPVLPGTGPLRSPNGLSQAVVVMLGVVIAADLFSLVVGFDLHSAWGSLLSGSYDEAPDDSYERAESLYGVTGVMQILTLVACAVVFVIWFHRVRGNAQTFAPDAHSKGPSWAVWGWIVPILSLWYPRRVALDIWTASAPEPHLALARRASSGLINLWWALWLVSRAYGNLASRLYEDAEDGAAIQQALVVLMSSDVLDIVAAVAAILVVRRITARQNEKVNGPALPAGGQQTGTPGSSLPGELR
ncbi:DUF4328 domain-containing protein [Streptomyces liangshanensis]|uniref:DUF4328 domain-containing protein n=1 Tax=Streptomyces liangshanensis TaxID=2717324 RepID=A0A6G9GZF5_9ACTN|nr:DUF4328 domain-containing protein [Streptomyces liangshanensis]QIQ03351.1 DUF4328 domain-containing protein [Streptomyces liangshanensis]